MNVSWKRCLGYAAWVLFLASAANLLRVRVPQLKAQSQSGVVPYTVVLRETITSADGTPHVGATNTRAVRSDGSSMLALGSLGYGERGSRIIYFASGITVQTDELQGKKSSIRGAPPSVKDPQTNCMNTFEGTPWTKGEVLLGQESLSGHPVVKIGATNGTQWWFALDLGCAPLKNRLDFGGTSSSEWNVVSISPGEPNAALFALPDNFAEGPPSSLRRRGANCGPDCEARIRREEELRDRHYFEHRAQ